MTKIVCFDCGKNHYLESIQNFKSCECGATMTDDSIKLIEDTENCIREIHYNISKRHSEGLSSKFQVDFI